MILYKAEREGIRVICQEESYTSKADITAMDPMPVYGREEGQPESKDFKKLQRVRTA